jgi:hypothetical protein
MLHVAERGQSRNPDLYRELIEFIRMDVQRERHQVNRRMFNVFIWCFVLPAAVSAADLILIKFHILPRSFRAYMDWMMLLFPVSYSLYVLGSEVLAQVPATFKRGGLASALGQSLNQLEWRERVCEAMLRSVPGNAEDWKWLVASFRMDLQAMQHRTRYLTALAGAVFFLLMQGIDTIGGPSTDGPTVWNKNPLIGWLESSSNDISQLVSLSLFLVLLYLSGSQTYHSLVRYLRCAELNLLTLERKSSGR